MSTNQSNEAKFFDLHTTGIGYLNRLREVTPRKGKPFMAVTVAALKGSADACLKINMKDSTRHDKTSSV